MERGRGQLVEDGKEKGPEQPEGEVEDEPNDNDGEKLGGRGRGVAVLGGVRAEARAVWRGPGSSRRCRCRRRNTSSSDAAGEPGWPASFSSVSF